MAENLYLTYLLGTFFKLLLKSDSVHYFDIISFIYPNSTEILLMEMRGMFTRDEHYDASHLNILMY